MIKRTLKNLKSIALIFTLMIFVGVLFTSCGGKKEKTYDISGYVLDELGEAVSNVEITSELGTVMTDESGKYTISGVSSSLILKPSKENYQFAEISKLVTSADDNANFIAYQNYNITGTVSNNEVPISNATVKIESLSGKFYTTTDSDGVFYGKNVAGEAKITCSALGEEFYPVIASIDSPEVKLSITTSATINLNFDDAAIDLSDIKLFVNDEEKPVTSSTIALDNIKCKTIIRLESTKYLFSKSMFVVESLNQTENIEVHKLYSIIGDVHSGETPLGGAKVYVNGKLSAETDSFGVFTVDGLILNNEISVKYENLTFNEISVSPASSERLSFNGTKPVYVNLELDKEGSDLSFDRENVEKVSDNKYLIKNAELGEEISVSSEKYHLSKTSLSISASNEYSIKAEAYYDLNLSIKDNLDAEIYLDNVLASEDSLKNLYGSHVVTAKFLNYVFDEAIVDAENFNVTLGYIIPYSVIVNVVSGTEVIENAVAKVNGRQILSENGKITISELVGENTILVESPNYNSKEIEVSGAEETTLELSYNVSGIVKTGNLPVNGALVSAGSVSATTNENGEYTLSNLTGKNIISASKENYSFEPSSEVLGSTSVWISGSYSISGTLSDENGSVSDIIVVLRSTDADATEITAYPDENGYYEFTGLTKTYFLLTMKNNTLSGLKPKSYNVSAGGTFDFNRNGFSVSGRVVSGGIGVASAYVTAGSNSTITDSDGYFVFELLTEACEIFVQKTGYDFSDSSVIVSDSDENLDSIEISGTYKVSGTIKLANLPLENVKVYVNNNFVSSSNENGEFTVLGVSGESLISFEKDGYVFENPVTVTGTSNISVSCKVKVVVKVTSGKNAVSDVKYFINGTYSGEVGETGLEIVVSYGDEITFEKTGYVISSLAITEPKTYEATSTYSVSGIVISGSEKVAGVQVTANGVSVISNELGEFTLTGLSGDAEIKLVKENFDFGESVIVSDYKANLEIEGSYGVSGKVVLGNAPSEGVKITFGEKEIYTTANGEFSLSGIFGRFSLKFEKEGYTFDEVSNRFGSEDLIIGSYYIVLGRVMSGDLAVSGAEVTASQENSSQLITIYSDQDGYFKLTGLVSGANIVISKDGYDSAQIAGIAGFTKNAKANLKYSILIKFDTTGVKLTHGDKVYQVNGKEITIPDLEGTNTFEFEKKYTSFSRSSLTVTEPMSLPVITSKVAYNITGQVKTESGVDAAGVTVYASGGSAVTDSNGKYTLNGVAGYVYINDFDSNKNDFKKDQKEIVDESSYNFTVSNLKFATILYENGYKNLDKAASVQIFGSGEVDAGAGGMQKVGAVFKRDNNGNIIKLNINKGKEIMGKNPTVALLTVYDAKSKAYKTNRSQSVNDNLEASFGSLETKNAGYFKSTFGAYPYEYSPYNVSKDTMKDISISVNTSGNYELKYSLTTNSQNNYSLQIVGLAPGGTSFNKFNKLTHTYEISKDGWIIKQYTDEEYVVHCVIDATTKSKITYQYKTNKPNLKIDDLDFSSNSTIQSSLKESSQAEIVQNSIESYSLDIVKKTIFG